MYKLNFKIYDVLRIIIWRYVIEESYWRCGCWRQDHVCRYLRTCSYVIFTNMFICHFYMNVCYLSRTIWGLMCHQKMYTRLSKWLLATRIYYIYICIYVYIYMIYIYVYIYIIIYIYIFTCMYIYTCSGVMISDVYIYVCGVSHMTWRFQMTTWLLVATSCWGHVYVCVYPVIERLIKDKNFDWPLSTQLREAWLIAAN